MTLAILLAATLTAGIDVDLDFGAIAKRHEDVARVMRTTRCGIRVVGHTIIAEPGTTVIVRRQRYTVPSDGQISFVDLFEVEPVRVGKQRVILRPDVLDQYSFAVTDLRSQQ